MRAVNGFLLAALVTGGFTAGVCVTALLHARTHRPTADPAPADGAPGGRARPSGDRLAAALNVAMAWHTDPGMDTAEHRDLELAGCRAVLQEWIDAD